MLVQEHGRCSKVPTKLDLIEHNHVRDLVNYPVHRRVLKFEKHREGVDTRVEVIVAKTARQSVVVKGYVDQKALDEGKIRKFLSRTKNSAKEVLDDLIPSKARSHLLDVWNVREGDGNRCYFTCRVTEPKVDSFMTLSGAGAIWFDTPSDHYTRDEVLLTWLKTQDDDGKGSRPMSKDEVDVVMRQNYGHLGIIQGKREDYAIRACKELSRRIRLSLGQPSDRLWRVTDIPPALE
eukprot:4466479-Amphidinium_carterae.1